MTIARLSSLGLRGTSISVGSRRTPRLNRSYSRLQVSATVADVPWKVQYLYDGECPLRRPEVEALQRLDNGKGNINFVDISKRDYDPSSHGGVTYEMAMGPPHAILPDGTIIKSVEVYRKLYESVGFGFVWAATKLPVVGPVVDGVFDVWTNNRLRLTGRPSLEEIVKQRAGSAEETSTAPSSPSYENFFNSSTGKFISSLSENIARSPANNAKVQLAALTAGSYDAAAVKAAIDKDIEENAVMMFSFSTCPFCLKAKDILKERGVHFKVLELDLMGAEGRAMRAELGKMTGRTSMPNIFIGQEGIGGCNDGPGIVTLEREGKLDDMLRTAGAL